MELEDNDIKKLGDYIVDKLHSDKDKALSLECPIGVMDEGDVGEHVADHKFIKTLRKYFGKFTDRLSNIGITIAIVSLFTIVYLVGMLFTKIDFSVFKLLLGE